MSTSGAAGATGAAGSSSGAGGTGTSSSHVVGSGCAVAPVATPEARWLWVLALGLAIRRARRQER
jgi:MYXO-CTERM domain-containing protein